MNLEGKKVIVTGGVKGIGNNLVWKIIDEGASVGVFDVDVEGLKFLEKEIPNIYCIECDVTDYKSTETAVDKFYNNFGKIDILVNNAGILYSAPLIGIKDSGMKKHDVDMWNKVISTDLSSVFFMSVNVVEKMILKRTKGVIVNISSVSASGNAGQSAYSAAKAGVNALTATWAKELGGWGIRVVGVAPGYSDTESAHKAMSEDTLREVISEVPLRRLGKVEEIVDGIISVIKNDFFNGKVFELDGGLIV
ncbi:SDR family NAD(P)-dependent oxidoreductase [Candidatus Woesearchaeota archaeon]|nr:SDR family NAD(P)-dependent oxidoreductase [Candidatus Woesearchaeota archaeon]MBT6052491.1 SDR family NAD(P)-dependent oxidoreductase [Candidatus Scalindua sp.]